MDRRRGLFTLSLCVSLFMNAHNSEAQDLSSLAQQNMNFDAQFNAQLSGMMQQNQVAQQQMMQNFVMQYGPERLQQEYQQFVRSTGAQITFEQFVYSHIMTQGGRNPEPALRQQQQNFQALQEANRTVQQGYNNYNAGYWQNQDTLGRAYNNYSQQGIMGNQYYQNPQTGEVVELPYGGPQGVYQNNQGTYLNGPNGQYQQVDPLGYTQDLNEYYGE